MNTTKVKVTSKHDGPVTVIQRDLRFQREWPNNGSSVNIDREILEELMNDTGFKYMIEQGILYIEDMQVKKDLGIEPDDATEPVNIIILSEAEKKSMMTAKPYNEFLAKLKTLGYEQLLALADYAIRNEYTDYAKCEAIQKACGKNIINAVRLNRQDKEEISQEV